jgi:hypothetical protein
LVLIRIFLDERLTLNYLITVLFHECYQHILLGNEILQKELVVIRKLAQLIGNLVASELGVNYAPLYYKVLEIEKDDAL